MAACRSTWSEPMPAVTIELQLRRLGDPLGRQVGGPERLGDDDLGVGQLACRTRSPAPSLSEVTTRVWPRPPGTCAGRLARDAAQKLSRLEVDGLGRGQGLAVRITVELRQIIAGIGFRIAIDRIVVKNANYFCHFGLPLVGLQRRTSGQARQHRAKPASFASGSVDEAAARSFLVRSCSFHGTEQSDAGAAAAWRPMKVIEYPISVVDQAML